MSIIQVNEFWIRTQNFDLFVILRVMPKLMYDHNKVYT